MKKTTFPISNNWQPCSLIANIYSKTFPQAVAWEDLMDLIQHDQHIMTSTELARRTLSTGDEKGYATAKAQCGAFIPAALFEGGRKQENITMLTGVSMVDFDHVPDDSLAAVLDLVRQDPHTFLCYTTTSGHGVRVLFRYRCPKDQLAYVDAWRWGNQYYAMLTDLPYDESTKDPTRLSFLCHDAQCYFNPQSAPFDILSSEEAMEQLAAAPDIPEGAEAEALAKHIADKHIAFTEGSRHSNLRYRAFLLNKMGFAQDDIARALSPDCPRGEAEARSLAQWVSDKGKADFGGWKGERPRSHKLPRPTLAQQFSSEGAPAEGRAKTATPEEVRLYLAEGQQLRYNVVSATVEMYSPEQQAFVPMNDRTQNLIWHQCIQALGKYVRMPDFNAEINSEFVPAFNPFRHYFDALPAWDGTDHIALLASRVTVKDGDTRIPLNPADPLGDSEPIFVYCFRKWLVAMVASWLDPKVMNETILTFIGAQGIYKSTFFRRLLPPELEGYFMAKGNSSYVSKDDKLAVSSRALIDFEEIDSMRDADLNAVKALVTTEVIDERSPYARNRERHDHVASFCATGNNAHFLTDITGNRRWLPFEVTHIASPHDNPIPYPQLYAQALALVKSGFQYWFTQAENALLEGHKNTFAAPCPEMELIAKYYRKPESWERGSFLTATEVLARCNADLRTALRPERIGTILRQMGIEQRTRKGRRGYILLERPFDEIALEKSPTPL